MTSNYLIIQLSNEYRYSFWYLWDFSDIGIGMDIFENIGIGMGINLRLGISIWYWYRYYFLVSV